MLVLRIAVQIAHIGVNRNDSENSLLMSKLLRRRNQHIYPITQFVGPFIVPKDIQDGGNAFVNKIQIKKHVLLKLPRITNKYLQ